MALRSVAVTLLLVLGCTFYAAADDPPARPRQYVFNIRICEGDPLGSREAGTLKVLANPTVVTLEKRPATLINGGEFNVPDGAGGEMTVTTGYHLEMVPLAAKGGKVRLDVSLSKTSPGVRTDDHTSLHTETTRAIMTVPSGEMMKLRVRGGPADKQVWAEVTVSQP